MTVLEDNNVQVQAWYIAILYKYLDVQVIQRITFCRYTAKARNPRHNHSLLLYGTDLLSRDLFSLILVFNICQDRSLNKRSGGGITAVCSYSAIYNTASFHFAVTNLFNDVLLGLGDKLPPNEYITKLQNHKKIMNIAVREKHHQMRWIKRTTQRKLFSRIFMQYTISTRRLSFFLSFFLSFSLNPVCSRFNLVGSVLLDFVY